MSYLLDFDKDGRRRLFRTEEAGVDMTWRAKSKRYAPLAVRSCFSYPLSTMLFTASPLQGRAVQSPAFQKRGIDGLTAGRLNQINHVGIAVEKQIAYDGYVTNLPAFLFATSVNKKVDATKTWYKAKLSSDLTIPLPLPPLCILPKTLFS